MDASTASLAGYNREEEIRPYKIHVSSKYLELTKKKLELTRLPHEILLPPAREWENGTPKSEIEPLIDYWLEKYSWRNQETHLNATLPQFRTALKANATSPALRIHFVHFRSQHPNAIPLLLIPSFPVTNLSLRPMLWKPLLEPVPGERSFHIVVPSIPGLGFSDAFNTTCPVLSDTAAIFDALMKRLGYDFYLASSTGSGSDSPAEIDYHLARVLGQKFPESCLGVHLLAPPLQAPTLSREPWSWTKFTIAKFFHAGIFGYQPEDFKALKESGKRKAKERWRSEDDVPALARVKGHGYGTIGMLGLREPNTLAYALCDSPTGLLSLVSSALRKRSPKHVLGKEEIIDVAQQAWLPGPEAALRFWSTAIDEVEEMSTRASLRARVAITVFGIDGAEEGYVCPAWGEGRHKVVFSQRVGGSPGLIAWERGDVIVEGVRGLASAVAKVDIRLKIGELERVVIGDAAAEPMLEQLETHLDNDDENETDADSPITVVEVALR